jgi:hypothetical protein
MALRRRYSGLTRVGDLLLVGVAGTVLAAAFLVFGVGAGLLGGLGLDLRRARGEWRLRAACHDLLKAVVDLLPGCSAWWWCRSVGAGFGDGDARGFLLHDRAVAGEGRGERVDGEVADRPRVAAVCQRDCVAAEQGAVPSRDLQVVGDVAGRYTSRCGSDSASWWESHGAASDGPNACDAGSYTPMLEQSAANTGVHPEQVLVDAGYCCDANLETAAKRRAEHGTVMFMATGPNPAGPPADTARPKPKAQANFIDPESRIMKNSNGAYVQAYNAQAVVDAHQIITAADVTTGAACGC